MNLVLKNIIEKLKLGNLKKIAAVFVKKGTNWIVMILLVLSFLYGGFLWYFYVYHSQWSEIKKQDYVRSKDKGAVFNRARFNDVVVEAQRRKSDYDLGMDNNLTDIFKLNSSQSPAPKKQ